MARPPPNPNVPAIPAPIASVGALAITARALKQGVDSLSGQSGKPIGRAVTFADLIQMQVITTLQAGETPAGIPAPVVNPYFVNFYAPTLGAGQVLFMHVFPLRVAFPGSYGALSTGALSAATAAVKATASAALSVERCLAASDPTVSSNWTTVGTITFAAAGYTGSFSGAPGAFLLGDRLRVVAPATADATLADVAITLVGQR